MPYKPTGRPTGRPRHPEPLTPAEQRVLRHLRHGKTNAEIADELDVSPDAVKYHVSNMLGKLELESREQLAAWREPSGLRRTWSGLGGVGWKLATVAGAAVVAVGIAAGGWLVLNGGDSEADETVDLSALATGVLTVGIDGQPADGPSMNPSISDDGRYVAFESEATNLVKDDTNGVSDIFVIDRVDGSVIRVSVAPGGGEANGPSHRPTISGDGKWVAFDSEASNLVGDDHNGEVDRVLALLPDELKPLVTSNGPYDWGPSLIGGSDVFVAQIASRTVELVSVSSAGVRGDLGSYWPSISRDGRYVAFESVAPSLLGGPAHPSPAVGVNPFLASDVFLRDRTEQTTTLVSHAPADEAPGTASGRAVVSSDGSAVAFTSVRTDLAGEAGFQARAGYVWKRTTGELLRIPNPPAPADSDGYLFVTEIGHPAITKGGALIAYSFSASASKRPNPEGIDVSGIFVYRSGDSLPTVVPGTEGIGQSSLAVSFTEDERMLVFQDVENQQHSARELDLSTGTTRSLSSGSSAPFQPVVSGDGKWIAALQDDGGRSQNGVPVFQVIVFPR
ncbi:MAG: LuxR C-terminal-related transcriptional regulator [Dehalococcoidia bacterium]